MKLKILQRFYMNLKSFEGFKHHNNQKWQYLNLKGFLQVKL